MTKAPVGALVYVPVTERDIHVADFKISSDQKHSTTRLTIVLAAAILNHMVEQLSARLDVVFQALADPTRRAMLRQLARQEHSVGELAAPFRMTLAAASKHIKALERAGLVRREVRGRRHICRLDSAPLLAADEWLSFYQRFWNDRLNLLARELRKPERPTRTRSKR